MTPTDWTPIVEAASRAHVESMRQGTWDELDTLTRYNVGQAILPAVRAAVEVVLKQQEENSRDLPWQVISAAGDVIAAHGRTEEGSCDCRWMNGSPVTTVLHAEHIADELGDAGFLRNPGVMP